MKECVVSLCDSSGIFAHPWAEAGYECFCVDIQHSIRRDRTVQHGAGRIHFVWGDVRSWAPPAGYRPIFVAAWTPCTHVSGGGARDHAKKRGFLLRDALEMFETARQAILWSGAPGFQENPVGILSSLSHIGKPDHYFHPSDYAGWCEDDNYTKKTCIWGYNGFMMPPQRPAPHLGLPDNRIHFASPSDDRSDIRSATPRGFSRAVHSSNDPRIGTKTGSQTNETQNTSHSLLSQTEAA